MFFNIKIGIDQKLNPSITIGTDKAAFYGNRNDI